VKKLDILINNGGAILPEFKLENGVELTIATNCLGPFYLTGLLLPLLNKTGGARIVTVVSTYGFRPKTTSIDFLLDTKKVSSDDMQERYNVSKAMNFLFGAILADKLAAGKKSTISVLAHPGFASTEFAAGYSSSVQRALMNYVIMPLFAQSPEMGTAPILMAATAPNVKNGEFFGPSGGWGEASGWPHHSTLKVEGVSADKDGFGKEMWKWFETVSKHKIEL